MALRQAWASEFRHAIERLNQEAQRSLVAEEELESRIATISEICSPVR